MLSLVNKPVLAHLLGLLKYHRFTDVIITVQYLADQIQNYFGDGRYLGLKLRYVIEETPLGTAGSIKNAQPYLDEETFLVISGDIITDIDLSRLVQFHREKQALATLALKRVADPRGYGLVSVDGRGRIRHYVEKPKDKGDFCHPVNTGIYILEPDILSTMQPKVSYDFSYDIFPHLLSQNMPLFGYLTGDYWCDMGTILSYQQATADVLLGKISHIDLGPAARDGIWLGRNVQIAPDVLLHGPIYLGDEVTIKRGVTICGPTVVAHQTVIDNWARIERSIIGPNCFVGEAVEVQGAIICRQCHLEPHSVIAEEVVIRKTAPRATAIVPYNPAALYRQPYCPWPA